MGYAKSMGIACYDLGGVDEAENPADYRFKKRMGGYLAERNASYEKMPGRPYEALIKIAERVYKKLKRRA